jgi:hypothetical protein
VHVRSPAAAVGGLWSRPRVRWCPGLGHDHRVGRCPFLSPLRRDRCGERVLEHDLAWILLHSRFLNYLRSLTIAELTGACTQCAWLVVYGERSRAAYFALGRVFEGSPNGWLAGPRSSCRRRHNTCTAMSS